MCFVCVFACLIIDIVFVGCVLVACVSSFGTFRCVCFCVCLCARSCWCVCWCLSVCFVCVFACLIIDIVFVGCVFVACASSFGTFRCACCVYLCDRSCVVVC